MQNEIYKFGPYHFDVHKQGLTRDGQPIQLSSRELDTLHALVKHKGELVSREVLIGEIWNDSNIADGSNNLSKQIGSLRKKLGKDEFGNDYVRTVPGTGYFIAAESVLPEGQRKQRASIFSHKSAKILFASILLAAVTGVSVWRFAQRQPSRASVAVLQFQNHQVQPGGEPLASVISEMIRTELAAGHSLRVSSGEETGRMTAEVQLPVIDSLDRPRLERIRKYLSADYVVNGSVTQNHLSSEIRVDLIVQDTRTGDIVTSDSVVGQEISLFDVVSRCGVLLRSRLGAGKIPLPDLLALKEELPANTQATQHYVEGLASMRSFEPLKAKEQFEAASREDPRSALIHSSLAEAWSTLGYEQNAMAESRRAFDLSKNLTRENQLVVEGRYREFSREGPRALEVYQALNTYVPNDLDYGIRLVRSQIKFGKGAETTNTIARLRKMPSPLGDDPRIDLVQAEAAENRGDFKAELSAANEALRKAGLRTNGFLVAKAQLKACWALDYLGDRDKALQTAKDAQKTFQTLGDKGDEAIATKNIADVLDDGGHHAEAVPIYEQAIEQFKRAGSMTGLAITLNNVGYAIKDLGDLERAQNSFEESARVCREIGDQGREAQALNGLAGVLKRKGRLTEAGQIYEEQLRRMEQTNQLDRAATVLNNLAEILQTRGRLSEAQMRFEQSLQITKGNGDKTAQSRTLGNLGELALLRGDLITAQKDFEDQLAIGTEIKEEKQRGYAFDGLGRVYFERADQSRAKDLLEKALAIRRTAGEKDLETETRMALAQLNPTRGELESIEGQFAREQRRDEQAEAQTALLRCALNAQPIDRKASNEWATKLRAILPRLEEFSVQLEVRSALAEYDAASGRAGSAASQLRDVFRIAAENGFTVQELETKLVAIQMVPNSSDRLDLMRDVKAKSTLHGLIRILRLADALR